MQFFNLLISIVFMTFSYFLSMKITFNIIISLYFKKNIKNMFFLNIYIKKKMFLKKKFVCCSLIFFLIRILTNIFLMAINIIQ